MISVCWKMGLSICYDWYGRAVLFLPVCLLLLSNLTACTEIPTRTSGKVSGLSFKQNPLDVVLLHLICEWLCWTLGPGPRLAIWKAIDKHKYLMSLSSGRQFPHRHWFMYQTYLVIYMSHKRSKLRQWPPPSKSFHGRQLFWCDDIIVDTEIETPSSLARNYFLYLF